MNIRTNITKVMLSIIIGVAVATSADAANTMCVTEGMQQVILDPSINGESYVASQAQKTWETTFSYGKVGGISTCNNVSAESASIHPEYNGVFDQNYKESTGNYCWCRMTSPVRSAWVLFRQRETLDDCLNLCQSYCGGVTKDQEYLRTALFGSAGM